MPPAALHDLLTRRALKRLAAAHIFQRGEASAASGSVRDLTEHRGALRATVDGAQSYRVHWTARGRDLLHKCSCPYAEDGELCKHAIAVALVWLDGGAREDVGAAPDTEAYLHSLGRDALVNLIVAHADEHDEFARQLEVAALSAHTDKTDLSTIKRAISAAGRVGTHELVRARDFTTRMSVATAVLDQLMAHDRAADVVVLAEHALGVVEHALSRVDDSNGIIGEFFRELAALHLRACAVSRPNPRALAKRLFTRQLRSDWDVFHNAAEHYADVLGDDGLAVYRALVAREWRRVRQLNPGDNDGDRFHGRFRITGIMESLARQSGDVEALVAVMSRTLASPYDFLRIAEAYAAAGQRDSALKWAERGVAAFHPPGDWRLAMFLGDEYAARKRYADALGAVWPSYESRPSLELYQRLKAYAGPAKSWNVVRARAQRGLSGVLCVEVLLWEQRIDDAWEASRAFACPGYLLDKLAALRAPTHPDDAVEAYTRLVDLMARRGNNNGYVSAVHYLRAILELLAKHGRRSEFGAHVAAVRTTHAAKRNLMKLLKDEGW